jgi:hypothetical protein
MVVNELHSAKTSEILNRKVRQTHAEPSFLKGRSPVYAIRD